jgi:hypothetical protein
MSMMNTGDILETIEMFTQDNLDVRTVTMGISLLDCIDPDPKKACEKIYNKITTKAADRRGAYQRRVRHSHHQQADQRHPHCHAAGCLPRCRPRGLCQGTGCRRQKGGRELCGRLHRPCAQGLLGR